MSALQKLKAYFGMVPAEDEGYGSYGDYTEYDDDGDYAPERRTGRNHRDGGRDDYADEVAEEPVRGRYRSPSRFDDSPVRTHTRAPEPAVHGALAMDRAAEPMARLRPVPEQARATVRDPLARITTLHPTNYAEARAIGEHYRDGTPVIMNLTEMENADAKRLVDFAAGLAFALRGSMDKVTNKVFLLSPPDVDVTAEDRRRIAEGGLFLRG